MIILKLSTYQLIFGIVFILFNIEISAQGNSEDNGNAGGIFEYEVKPISSLSFGTFSVDQFQEGKIIIDFNGIVTPSGGVDMVPFGPTPSAGEFEISVTKGKANIIFSESPSNVLVGPLNTNLIIDDLSFSQNSVYVDKFIELNIKMGGTITIPPAAPQGDYIGTVDVIFTYE